MNDKAREGFWLSIGTLAAQGAVEAAERFVREGHTNGHWVAFGVALAAWLSYRLSHKQ